MRQLKWSALLLLATTAGCDHGVTLAPKFEPTEVVVSTPTERKVTDYEEFTGHTDGILSVQIKARVTGYLHSRHFLDGQDVKQGDLLYQIDDRPYKAAFDSAESSVAQDEAHRNRLAKDYQRAANLFQRAAIGKQEFDLISSDFAESEAQLGASKARLETARLNMSFTKVIAPMNGQLSRTLVDPGNLVRQDVTILNDVVSTDKLYAYFDLSVDAMERVKQVIAAGLVGTQDNKEVKVYVGTTIDADHYEDGMRRVRDLADEVKLIQDQEKKTIDDTELQVLKLTNEFGGPSKLLAAEADAPTTKRSQDLDARGNMLAKRFDALKEKLSEVNPEADPALLEKQKKAVGALEGLRKKLLADLAEKNAAIRQKRTRLAEEEKSVPPEFPYDGEVNFAENKLDAATGTLRVRGIIKNQNLSLIPGLFVRVRLPIGNLHDSLLLPEDAIGSDQGRSFVYVINSKDEVEYRPIEIGALFEGDAGRKMRAVRKGIESGDRFIQDSETIRRVRPGARVKVIQPDIQVASTVANSAS